MFDDIKRNETIWKKTCEGTSIGVYNAVSIVFLNGVLLALKKIKLKACLNWCPEFEF